ncbi:hypothetical protein [Roseomonas sp. CECT 9278]|uniref:hypothetical protein n=1 Tax=Roseomonas sp. CECT 9278 TaxID=2845823 RepID=UPI001E48837C|nr:hypothetical protein [Roseomonas sp. CECT 9278]CAH0149387.1 hypothetical protein ROS9278_00679 [Roseomonas sp. CECT 9278]
MARVADYSIIVDSWISENSTDSRKFTVPDNIHPSSRSILTFMFDADSDDGVTVNVRLNGSLAWTWTASSGDSRPVRFFQEVVAAGVVKPGENVFSYNSSSSDSRTIRFSDVVLFWQASI